MINLIKNELKKLIGRPFALVPFFLCLGCFVLFFFHCSYDCQDSTMTYTTSETVTAIMEQLAVQETADTRYQLHKYEYILEKNLHIPIRGWQMTALNEAFGYYQKKICEESATPHEIAAYYRYFKLLCQAVRTNSSNDYLQLLAERVQEDDSLSSTEKYYYTQYYSYLITQNIEPDTGDWRQEAADDLLESSLSLARLELQASDTDAYDSTWQKAYNKQAVAKYRLEQNVSLLITDTDFGDSIFWKSLFDSRTLLPLLQIPILFLLSAIIAGEIRLHNLNLLFSQPVNRQNYFTAKLCAAMIICTGWILFIFTANVVTASLLFGTEDLQASTLFVRDGMVNAYSTLLLLLKHYFLICLPIYVTAAFCLFCSALVPYSGVVTAAGLSGMVLSWCAGQHVSNSYLAWTSYSIIGSLDILSIIKGSAASGQTLPYALFILFLHLILFVTGAGFFFCRKQL